MKFTVRMKTPDCVEYAVENVIDNVIENVVEKEHVGDVLEGPSYAEVEEIGWKLDKRRGELKELLSKWFRYGECVTIEIDTEAETATVLEA